MNKRTIVIGIAGLARSGKDTIADFLQEAFNDQKDIQEPMWGRYSFATPLKQMLHAGLGMEDKDPRAKEIYGQTYRHMAQTLGTEWGRNMIGENIWLKTAEFRLINNCTIISDVRFEDEAEFCRKHGIMIHVQRPALVQELSASEQAHSSEAGLDILHGDYKIINLDTGLENLEALVKSHVLNDVLEKLALINPANCTDPN